MRRSLVDPSTRREGLEAMCTQRIHGLTAGSKTDLLVTWTIGGRPAPWVGIADR